MNLKYYCSILLISLVTLSSCVKKLDSGPIDPNVTTSADVYKDTAAYKMVLAKLYAGLATTGQSGPVGQPDLSKVDEGYSAYLRQYWCAQELTTEEAIIGHNGNNIKDYHFQNWGVSNISITALYGRLFYQIALCNGYIRDLNARLGGLSGKLKQDVTHYLAEARFLRALSYYHALDLFGNVPFVTENDPIGKFFPRQIGKRALFAYIESELKAIDADLVDARANEYARADKAVAWSLLTNLYLNASVYIGEDHFSDCIGYCNKIIGAGYNLHPDYSHLFLADNQLNNPEIIFPVAFDGIHTKSYGGTNFIILCKVGGSMKPADYGIAGGWAGLRTSKTFVTKFADISGNTDKRAMFHMDGQNLEIADVSAFSSGYAISKFSNVTSQGEKGSSLAFVDTDYPVFRLADIYLVYAEAVLRGGSGGDPATALQYINALRQRAYGNNSGNITANELTLNFILDERSRELYWEGHRRTDLIRYGLFTGGDYLWPWKGGIAAGEATESFRNVFPIPGSEIGANPLLIQNTGY